MIDPASEVCQISDVMVRSFVFSYALFSLITLFVSLMTSPLSDRFNFVEVHHCLSGMPTKWFVVDFRKFLLSHWLS